MGRDDRHSTGTELEKTEGREKKKETEQQAIFSKLLPQYS